MAVRTQSTTARAMISSGRIKAGEEKKLQRAIDDLQNSIDKYNEEVGEDKSKKSKWGWLTKVGGYVTKIGALTANPVIGGAGLLMTGAGARAEYNYSQGMVEEARKIETEAAKRLEGLLFVGEQAVEVGAGASTYKSGQVSTTKDYRTKTFYDGVLDFGKSLVAAGQAGTFDTETFGSVSDVLNKPLYEGAELGEDATKIDKLADKFLTSKSPSIGSVLGGVTPQEQEVYGGAIKDFFTPVNSITGGTTSNVVSNVSNEDFTENLVSESFNNAQEVTTDVAEVVTDVNPNTGQAAYMKNLERITGNAPSANNAGTIFSLAEQGVDYDIKFDNNNAGEGITIDLDDLEKVKAFRRSRLGFD